MSHRSLTDDDVREIVALFHAGYGQRTIARLLVANEETVKSVLYGRTYREITGGRLTNGKRPRGQLRHPNQHGAPQ